MPVYSPFRVFSVIHRIKPKEMGLLSKYSFRFPYFIVVAQDSSRVEYKYIYIWYMGIWMILQINQLWVNAYSFPFITFTGRHLFDGKINYMLAWYSIIVPQPQAIMNRIFNESEKQIGKQ